MMDLGLGLYVKNDILGIFQDFLRSFGNFFRPSFKVDFLLLLLDLKPCLRTPLKTKSIDEIAMNDWCQRFHFSFLIRGKDFFYLGRDKSMILKASEIDLSARPHEYEFGALLGYPTCCLEKIVKVGEANIDAYEAELSYQNFDGEFFLINPAKYLEGNAFISHVPCSSCCNNSLMIAKKLADFVRSNSGNFSLKGWEDELCHYRHP